MTIEHDTEDGAGTLLGAALATVVGALLWVLIILAIRWVLQLPPPALLRVGAVAGLFGGTALIFVSLARAELSVPPSPDPARGRRPARGVAPPGAARASSGASALPQAGGRALHVRFVHALALAAVAALGAALTWWAQRSAR